MFARRHEARRTRTPTSSCCVADGEAFAAGTPLARVTGNARAVLLAERVALNLVQRMSAIATKTAEFVALVDGTKARITDTRKTTPGLRVLERYAVRCGGGANHRYSLSDAVLAKDNHLAVMTGGDPAKLTALLRGGQGPAGPHHALRGGGGHAWSRSNRSWPPGWTPSCWTTSPSRSSRAGVELVGGRARVEASGNVNLATVADIAATGVDVISIGGLTHSVTALDLGPGRRADGRLSTAMIFLDAAATTPVRREVLEAMWPYLTRRVRQPLEPPLARRGRRLGARRSPGSRRPRCWAAGRRDHLHLRRHGGGQPCRQRHRPGPAGRGPAR